GQLRVAQIVIHVRPDENSVDEQQKAVQKLRDRAAKNGVGLGKAASEKGLATTLTGYFDLNNPAPALSDAPEALDWGILNKVGSVSPVFRSADGFTIAQVA